MPLGGWQPMGGAVGSCCTAAVAFYFVSSSALYFFPRHSSARTNERLGGGSRLAAGSSAGGGVVVLVGAGAIASRASIIAEQSRVHSSSVVPVQQYAEPTVGSAHRRLRHSSSALSGARSLETATAARPTALHQPPPVNAGEMPALPCLPTPGVI